MINGAHAIVYSTDSDADKAFFRDILGLPHVDVGEGWLIFGLPPAEVAVHPSDGNGESDSNGRHEIYFMCDDVELLRERLSASNVESSDVSDQGWGLVTQVTLPGGSKLGIYQPRHARPEPVKSAGARAARSKAKKPAAVKAKGKAKAKKAPAKAKPVAAKASKAIKAAKAPKAKKAAKKKPRKAA